MAVHSRARQTATTTAMPMGAPMRPPISPRMLDSPTNCAPMWRGVAPRARRSPISGMRSMTETVVRFVMPNAPTSRVIPASARNSVVRSPPTVSWS